MICVDYIAHNLRYREKIMRKEILWNFSPEWTGRKFLWLLIIAYRFGFVLKKAKHLNFYFNKRFRSHKKNRNASPILVSKVYV